MAFIYKSCANIGIGGGAGEGEGTSAGFVESPRATEHAAQSQCCVRVHQHGGVGAQQGNGAGHNISVVQVFKRSREG